MFVWRILITDVGPHLLDFESFSEHTDEIRSDLQQRLKLQNLSERNPTNTMEKQETLLSLTHTHTYKH